MTFTRDTAPPTKCPVSSISQFFSSFTPAQFGNSVSGNSMSGRIAFLNQVLSSEQRITGCDTVSAPVAELAPGINQTRTLLEQDTEFHGHLLLFSTTTWNVSQSVGLSACLFSLSSSPLRFHSESFWIFFLSLCLQSVSCSESQLLQSQTSLSILDTQYSILLLIQLLTSAFANKHTKDMAHITLHSSRLPALYKVHLFYGLLHVVSLFYS